jgi:hypothetical protein
MCTISWFFSVHTLLLYWQHLTKFSLWGWSVNVFIWLITDDSLWLPLYTLICLLSVMVGLTVVVECFARACDRSLRLWMWTVMQIKWKFRWQLFTDCKIKTQQLCVGVSMLEYLIWRLNPFLHPEWCTPESFAPVHSLTLHHVLVTTQVLHILNSKVLGLVSSVQHFHCHFKLRSVLSWLPGHTVA